MATPATKHFAQCWIQARETGRGTKRAAGSGETKARSQVVAFSDPNDILSWRLEPKNLKLPRPFGANRGDERLYVERRVQRSRLFSDPANAHTGYFVNPTVIDMLICGMDNGAVGACRQNRTP